MSKYCDEVEGAIYMDEQGVVHDLSVEDVAELGYLFKAQLLANNNERRAKDIELKDLSNEPVAKVEPKPFDNMHGLFKTSKVGVKKNKHG